MIFILFPNIILQKAYETFQITVNISLIFYSILYYSIVPYRGLDLELTVIDLRYRVCILKIMKAACFLNKNQKFNIYCKLNVEKTK